MIVGTMGSPRLAWILSLVLALRSHAVAQVEAGRAAGKEGRKIEDGQRQEWKGRGWSWSLDARTEIAYDSNIFKLSDDQIDRLEEDRPADETSGRFDDMESVDDVIVTPALRLNFEGPGLGGEEFRISPRADFDYFVLNTKKSHPEFGLELRHGLDAESSLGLDVSYALDVFKKNYLADATDFSDSVSADERVYEAGVYDALDTEICYRRRLWKREKSAGGFPWIEGLHGRALLGYRNANYEDPFDNRDSNELRSGVGLEADIAHWLELDIHYVFGYVDTPSGDEVMIRDESDFGVDLNGDGDAADTDIRTEQNADRSRLEQALGGKATFRLAKAWSLWGGYDVLFQDYTSDETFDLAHKNRNDLKQRARVGIEWRFARNWAVDLEGQWIRETVNKGELPDDDEEEEYDRFIVSATLSLNL